MLSKKCSMCDNTFKSFHPDAAYCSGECRKKGRNIAQRLRKNYQTYKRNCRICSNEFETIRKRQICCGKECSAQYKPKFVRKPKQEKVISVENEPKKEFSPIILRYRNLHEIQLAKRDVQNVLDRYAVKETKWRVFR